MPRTPARTSHWPLDALLDHHVTHSVVVTALIFPLPRSVRPPQVCLLAAMPTLWTSSAGPRMWGADPKGPFSGEDSLPPLISLGHWDRERHGWRRRMAWEQLALVCVGGWRELSWQPDCLRVAPRGESRKNRECASAPALGRTSGGTGSRWCWADPSPG